MPYIAAGSTLLTGGLQYYLATSAQEDARRDHERVQALKIKFNDEENERLNSEFTRTHGLKREKFDFDKKQQGFENMKSILDSITGIHNNNLDGFNKLKDSFGSRRRK